eukprot:jgi/Phyca11/21724/fgenesh1_pg.PHYCAscaffold_111_\
MANLLDSKVQGSTGFSSNSVGCYRYEISLHSGQVNIWLEDQSSKKQWETGLLNKEDYVTTANVFVDASVSDYVLSIAVERIDILESKLKDVQEELGRLRGKIGSAAMEGGAWY